MARLKVTVVGAGNVGGTAAQRLAEQNAYDVVLVDIAPGMPQGKALDMTQAGPVCGYDTRVVGTNGYEETAGSAVAIITSGIPRKPGMSRDELLATNAKIVTGVVKELVKRSPDIILVLVTNPLDAMTYVAHKVSGLPKQRVLGMAGVLDSARFRAFIAEALNVPAADVQAMVLGGHGDTMVPLLKHTTVKGRPIAELLPKDKLNALVKRTQDGGAEIVNLLKTGSAFYAPAASAVDMVEAMLKDQKRVLPCAVKCEGEYGIDGLFVGVPARLGRKGVESIEQYDLSADEKAALAASARAVKELCDAVDRLL
ncbi:MAG: malate dehydrogenase [Nitrospirae bacterium RIFCSPLOWO2_12_FULL_63_8]|nr:MAG: malate dehydrogenase [Nitrospirae bacterium RIFCSPLOWO2_12_FULL_63_8]